jgi:hypothetical protein
MSPLYLNASGGVLEDNEGLGTGRSKQAGTLDKQKSKKV